MGSRLGALKGAAKHLGLTLEEYLAHVDSGELWCSTCKTWHPSESFGKDPSRGRGRAYACLDSRHTGRPRGWHGRPNINPKTGKPGPAPKDRNG